MSRRDRGLPRTFCPHIPTAAPTVSGPHQNGAFVTSKEPTGTHHLFTQSPWFPLGFTVGLVDTMHLDKRVKTCVQHYGIAQSSFTALKTPLESTCLNAVSCGKSRAGLGKILCKDLDCKYLGFVGHTRSAGATQLCCCGKKAALGDTQAKGHGCVPIKLWMLKFEFHIILTCCEGTSFF